jgi:hypothetical protein
VLHTCFASLTAFCFLWTRCCSKGITECTMYIQQRQVCHVPETMVWAVSHNNNNSQQNRSCHLLRAFPGPGGAHTSAPVILTTCDINPAPHFPCADAEMKLRDHVHFLSWAGKGDRGQSQPQSLGSLALKPKSVTTLLSCLPWIPQSPHSRSS